MTFNSNVKQWICWTSLQFASLQKFHIHFFLSRCTRLNHSTTNKGFLQCVMAEMAVNIFFFHLFSKRIMFSIFFFHRGKILYQRLPRYPPVVPFPYLNVGPVSKQVATASPGGPALISPGQISAIRSCHRTLLQKFSCLRCTSP